MENTTMVSITNRNNGSTGYEIPDLRINRTFAPGETKKIPLEELKQLQYVPGGDYMLKNLLIVTDVEALDNLNMSDVEPEYFYTEKEIEELLNNGSLDQLEDTLNFAPEGVIELIKTMAIKSELPDTRKRKLITEKTGMDIDGAIRLKYMLDAEIEDEGAEETAKTRKAQPITANPTTPARKAAPVATQKYKVVEK